MYSLRRILKKRKEQYTLFCKQCAFLRHMAIVIIQLTHLALTVKYDCEIDFRVYYSVYRNWGREIVCTTLGNVCLHLLDKFSISTKCSVINL